MKGFAMWNYSSASAGIVRHRPELRAGSVHVWFARLDRPDVVVSQLFRTLSSDEQQRSARFQFARDRTRFILASAGLRGILALYLGGDPQRFSFRFGPFGKPALAGDCERSGLRFNMSHSGNGALYAVAPGREVGIDLEVVRPLPDMMSLAETCFSPLEMAAFRAMPERQRLHGFFAGWTRKEAFLKASGQGLSLSLKSFEVSLAPGIGPQPMTVHSTPQAGRAWTLISLPPPGPEYSAALVIEERDWQVTCFEWQVPPICCGDARASRMKSMTQPPGEGRVS
jgi:4'-phosphopantetheinyl transferase